VLIATKFGGAVGSLWTLIKITDLLQGVDLHVGFEFLTFYILKDGSTY